MGRVVRIAAVAVVTVAFLGWAAPSALAHEERKVTLPDGSGSVPAYRTDGPQLLVCKSDLGDFRRRVADFPAELRARNLELFEACQGDGFRHLQDAVDRVERPGTRILVLPGTYREEPSLAPPSGRCANLPAPWAEAGGYRYQVMSYSQHRACPHNQNLVAVLGVRDLQIEGTGASPADVVVDAGYRKLNAIRADRADGIYLRNFTAQRTRFNAVYVMEIDGFVIDRLVGRWNDEYGFLTFATDHGLYTDCEAYGNGDSGVYPGSASNINDGRGHDVLRYAVEIRRCRSHHNLLGYSGTAGDSVWVHDNELYENSAGASMDSAFPGHPGLPQNHALFENNSIHDNNVDYYGFVRDGTCAWPAARRGYERGVVCPAASVPVGTGVLTAGGNYNVFRDNQVYGNGRAGLMLFWVPAFIRGESDPSKLADTSHHNRYLRNEFGLAPDGRQLPNGMAFWWDGQGRGNCWQRGVTSDPEPLPACGSAAGSARLVSEPTKLATLLVCSDYSLDERRVPAGCSWYGASGLARTDVQLAMVGSVLLAGIVVLLWWRRLRGTRTGAIATAAGLLGAAAGVFGAAYGATPLSAVAFALLGLWWLGAGWILRRDRPGFGWTTLVLGVLALVDAFDHAVMLVPLIPVQPAWLRLVLTVVWTVWAVVVLVRRPRRHRQAEPAAGEPVASGAT
ncbi:MAG: hypothetical protein GEV03_01635 [Streptosporangiales bacterium]|nr:hypothetical protein [Streptosporangiales bacterium]